MNRLDNSLARLLRPANNYDIQSWSFGAVMRKRRASATEWIDRRDTLDDEAIFGPRHDYRCACGKYNGEPFANTICELCGVKLASVVARHTRFGHINLPTPLTHDVLSPPTSLDCFPVLPASFRESVYGRSLDELYEDLLQASEIGDGIMIQNVYHRLCAVLVPAVVMAYYWGMNDFWTLAKGLGLVGRTPDDC